MNIENFVKDSFRNRSKIKPDEKVSCYYCCTTYLGKYITEWTGDDTAICPCGIDSVVPYEVDAKTLRKAHDRWFGYPGETIQDYKNSCENIPGVNFVEGD